MRNKLNVILLCLALTLVPSPTGVRDPEMAQFPDGATPEPRRSEAPSEPVMAEDVPATAPLDDSADDVVPPIVKLDYSSLSLDMDGGMEASLVASILPETPEGIVYHWTSSDPEVAMVSDTGEAVTITGMQGGASTITVQVSSDDLPEVLTAACEVAVQEPLISLSLSAEAMVLSVGEETGSVSVLASLPKPDSHTETIAWDVEQDGEVIAFEPSRGTVRALKPGTALVVATASGGLSAQCKVLVRGAEKTETIQPGTVSGNSNPQRALTGAPAALRAETADSAAEDADLQEQDALRTLVTQLEQRPWEALLTQHAPDALQAFAPVAGEPVQTEAPIAMDSAQKTAAVEEYVRFANDGTALGISIRGEPVTLQAGAFDAQGMLIDAPLSWSSSDTKVARVDEDGILRPVRVGKAIITATSPGGASATCAVTVYKAAAQSMKLFTDSPAQLTRGKQLRPNVGYSPMHSYAPLRWSSSDERVVQIDPLSGLMTAVGKGKAVVTATSPDLPEASLTLEVQVSAPILAMSMYKDAKRDDSYWLARPGEARMLYVEIEPGWDIISDTVVWSSNAPKVASVDKATGEVTAHRPGKAIITAKAGSGIKATCTVAVE